MTLRVLAVDVTGAEVSTGPSPAGAPSQPVPGGDEVCDCHRMAALVASKIRSPSGPSLTAHGSSAVLYSLREGSSGIV